MNIQNNESTVALIKAEINRELGDAETLKSLLDTTFKGLKPEVMKRALLEGMLRGFSFKEFLNRDVYAIAYGETYSLVTSIDHARKIGAKSGIVGVEKPEYELEASGKPLSCSVTVKKRFPDGYIGEFTAEVDFKEYSTGKNLWASKPKTMIAKVAEMHALRKACPELADMYAAEEFERQQAPVHTPAIDLDECRRKLLACKDIAELERTWADMPGDAKAALKEDMERVKSMIMSEVQEAA